MSNLEDKGLSGTVEDLAFLVQPRERPDRHPYQIGCLVGMICVSLSQIIIGIPPESALYHAVPERTMLALNACFIVGALLGLVGSALPRSEDPRLSLRLGIFGQFAVAVGTVCYSIIVMSITEAPYWLSVLSAGLGLGLFYASLHRAIQQMYALHDIQRVVKIVHRQEP